MSKVTLNHMFETASGKLCRKSSTYVILNHQTGKMVTAEYHERSVPDTEAQRQVKKTFTERARLASSWWNANKPSTTNADGTAAYQLVLKAYKNQRKIGNPYSYLRSLVTPDAKIMLGDLDITNGATTSGGSSSGGSSSSGGLEG